ncbi:MAG: protein-disulfide reductase DsbD [Bdellovibrionales bacterium]|nr:protein-disulfide reductase DsbD [Bdellovibrionales bacterium]
MILRWTIIGLMWACSIVVLAQEEINENPLSIVSAHIEKETLSAGSSSGLKVELELAEGHHAYIEQFRLTALQPEGVSVGKIELSPVVEFFDKLAQKNKRGVKGGGSSLKSVIELPIGLPIGAQSLQLQLRYQACTDEYCLFPKKLPIEIPIKVVANEGDSHLAVAAADSGPALGLPIEVDFQSGNWVWIFLVVFFAGFLTSFTPCIFPMIPITLTVLGARGSDQSHLQGFIRSLSYVFGIAMTYSILGLIAASTGSLFGSLLGHPVVIICLALLFATMSLSMLGLFELKAPSFVSQKLSHIGGGSSLGGAFLIGAAAGIVASPCVGPILVSILAYVAQSQQLLLGFGLLFTFAMGMGLIFIALGTFSQLIQKLPKSGNWMDGVKYLFAFLMMALAVYYMNPLLSPGLFNFISVVGLLAFSLFFLIRKNMLLIRFLGLLILVLAFAIAGGSFSKDSPRFGTLINSSNAHSSHSKVPWTPLTEEALIQAQNEGRPVIVDFVADWCASCKELDAYTFSNAEVLKATADKKVIWMQYDATMTDEVFEQYKKRFNILGLPTVLFFDKSGIRDDLRLTGFETAESFLKRIEKL